MKKQKGFYWKKVRISLFKFTTLYTEKQQDLKLNAIEYNPDGESCQMCAHSPIKNIFILKNTKSGEELRIGSECAVNYVDEVFLARASGLLRKEIFSDIYKDTIEKINSYPFKTKAMVSFLNCMEKGNYPWKELNEKLEKDFKGYTFERFNEIKDFTKENQSKWICREVEKQLTKGYVTDWNLKEIIKTIDKKKEIKEAVKEIKKETVKEEVKEQPAVKKSAKYSREELKNMSLAEKLSLL